MNNKDKKEKRTSRFIKFLAELIFGGSLVKYQIDTLQKNKEEENYKETFRFFKPEIHEHINNPKKNKTVWVLRDKPLSDEEMNPFFE